ncbi:hypothetical protein REPUB_Repub03eG0119300 [Reevesia pubescens]
MESSAGMVAGSHRRNELVRICHDSDRGPKPLKNLNGQTCQICGDNVGLTAAGEVFFACNECAFPVCQPCYEYERKDGTQCCPQCKTRYKRHKVPVRIVDPTKDLNSYGLWNVDWKERVESWKLRQEKNVMQMTSRYLEGKGDIEGTDSIGEELQMADDARLLLSRVVLISSSHITHYRVLIILRLIILGFFLQYRATHPVKDAYPFWLTSVICEFWFALSWLLDQFPKWSPINRETYLDRLALRSVLLLYQWDCFLCG